jgi:integrase
MAEHRLPRGISRLPSGLYRVRLYRDGRTLDRAVKGAKEAEQIRARWIAELDRGSYIDPSLGRITCSAWFADWLATGARRASTEVQYATLWRLHVEGRIGERPLSAVTPLDVQQILDAAHARGLSAGTVRAIRRLLVAVFNGAVKARRITRTPAEGTSSPKLERSEQRYLTAEELIRLADAIEPRYRALVLLGGFAGLRIGELAGLEVRHLDLIRRRVRVDQQATEVGGRLDVGPPKSEAARRTIAIGEHLAAEVAEHLRVYRPGAEPTDRVFTAPLGGPLVPSAFRRRAFSRGVAAADLGKLRVHDLRHTSVALAIEAGMHIEALRRRLGHTSVTTTLGVYGHLFDGMDEEAAARQERALAGAMERVGADTRTGS